MEPDIVNNETKDLRSPEFYFNRELSFIEFNKRVLIEAEDKSHPLLERLKFVSIFSSNLDEFFMVRVAGLKRQISAGVVELSYDGMTPSEQLVEIRKRLTPLYKRQQEILYKDILPALEKEKIIIHHYENLTKKDKEYLKDYFDKLVLPVLTPLSLDPAHPFPRIINRRLNVAFVLRDQEEEGETNKIAFLQLPIKLSRFVKLPRKNGHHFVLLEQVIKAFADTLFPGLEIEDSNTFRVTRDCDQEIAEDEAEDLMFEIAEHIKQRRWGTAAVRLEVSSKMPDYLVKMLQSSLDVDDIDLYIHNRPLGMPDFAELAKIEIRHLRDKPFATRVLPELQSSSNVFDVIRNNDLMMHHPFDSFTNSTLRFIREAADDPDVLAIKITLYRTGLNSPVVAALKQAAENGKDVTAFVELKARFDEENNIIWAKELEQTGVHVIYGILGLKTHCKICMVVRKEYDEMRTYLHMATGNYNQVTARLYTDIGFFTSRKDFGYDAMHLFNYLTGYSHYKDYKHLIVAPVGLYQGLVDKIRREAENHTPENPGLIFAKMNSLVHRRLIPELYKASQKGVKIMLLVRGICCLRPGIPGVSDNIEVRSVLGRFLEHSRIFYFKNGGDDEFFLSSADWMSRNLHKRVELTFPVYDQRVRNRLWEILNLYWQDNTKSWRLRSDGDYERLTPQDGEKLFNAQEYFLNEIKISRDKMVQHQ